MTMVSDWDPQKIFRKRNEVILASSRAGKGAVPAEKAKYLKQPRNESLQFKGYIFLTGQERSSCP